MWGGAESDERRIREAGFPQSQYYQSSRTSSGGGGSNKEGCAVVIIFSLIAAAVGGAYTIINKHSKSHADRCPTLEIDNERREKIYGIVRSNLACIERKTDSCVRESANDDERRDCLLVDADRRYKLAKNIYPFTVIYPEPRDYRDPDYSPERLHFYNSTNSCFEYFSYPASHSEMADLLESGYLKHAEQKMFLEGPGCPDRGYPTRILERNWERFVASLNTQCKRESVSDWRRITPILRRDYDEYVRQQTEEARMRIAPPLRTQPPIKLRHPQHTR